MILNNLRENLILEHCKVHEVEVTHDKLLDILLGADVSGGTDTYRYPYKSITSKITLDSGQSIIM